MKEFLKDTDSIYTIKTGLFKNVKEKFPNE